MILKDQYGNEFTWKVCCIAKPTKKSYKKCYECDGRGYYYSNYYPENDDLCNLCHGKGVIAIDILCSNQELEKYLEKYINQYYIDKKKREIETFLGENI